MNKIKLGCALLLVASLGSSAYASGYYAKVSGGISDVDADRKDGSNVEVKDEKIFSIAVGKSFDAFDIEAEYSRGTNDWENKSINTKGDGKETGYFLNGYYNFNTDTKVTPYLGVGIGRLKYNDGFTSSTETAYQGMLGCAYELNDHFDLNMEYKYRDVGYDTIDFKSNNYMVGVKYKF